MRNYLLVLGVVLFIQMGWFAYDYFSGRGRVEQVGDLFEATIEGSGVVCGAVRHGDSRGYLCVLP